MPDRSPICLDYFSGGVPTGEAFRGTLDDISKIKIESMPHRSINRLAELCFVGVLSYFEAFCKDHAASVVSLAPDLISKLKTSGHNTLIDGLKASRLGEQLPPKLGFLIFETVDFGSARKINSIFQCLLKITPFSKIEANRYDDMLRDRNLIVHHGSIFTTRYLEQSKAKDSFNIDDAFMNSLIIDQTTVSEQIKFISSIAKNMMFASHTAVTAYLSETSERLDPERQKALDYFQWWGSD